MLSADKSSKKNNPKIPIGTHWLSYSGKEILAMWDNFSNLKFEFDKTFNIPL